MGCETVFSGTPDYDITKQIASFEQDLVKKPAGILLHPMQADPFIEPINRAIDERHRRRHLRRRLAEVEAHLLHHLRQSRRSQVRRRGDRQAGRRQRASMPCSRTPARATTTCASPRFIAYMDKNYPKMKLVGRQASNQDSNAAYKAVASMLQANPNLKALWIPEAGSAEGAVAAVLEAKAKVLIMHADVTPTTLEHIKAGNIHMALNPNQGMQGYLGFVATFMAAHPDLIDPFNDYKVSGYNPMQHPLHRQRLRRHHQGERRLLRPEQVHGRARSELSRRPHRRSRRAVAARASDSPFTDGPEPMPAMLPTTTDPQDHPTSANRSARSTRCAASTSSCARGEIHAHRRRERRRQVDADEHHRRHPAPRQRRDPPRRQAGRDHLAGRRRRSSASASSTRRSRSARMSRWPRTSSWRRPTPAGRC